MTKVDGGHGPCRVGHGRSLPRTRRFGSAARTTSFAVIATWKDYLWPLLVLRDPNLQPLSVRLPTLQPTTELDVFIAALTISSIIPIALFLVFQRMFLRGAGLSGAIKG
jgi:multiple sugar transport system permease protein